MKIGQPQAQVASITTINHCCSIGPNIDLNSSDLHNFSLDTDYRRNFSYNLMLHYSTNHNFDFGRNNLAHHNCYFSTAVNYNRSSLHCSNFVGYHTSNPEDCNFATVNHNYFGFSLPYSYSTAPEPEQN